MSHTASPTAAPAAGSLIRRPAEFARRHVGPSEADVAVMLKSLGLDSLEALVGQTVPAAIRLGRDLALPQPAGEPEALAELAALAGKNRVLRSYVGMGYHGTHVPAVVLRNVLENPGWYTQYTPYQAEI